MTHRRRPSTRITLTSALLALGLVVATVAPARPASALTGNEMFVIAVYQDFLMRGPDTDEMNWWTGYLGSGSRTTMVATVLASDEFETLWVAGTQSYYLGFVDAEGSAFSAALSALQTSGDYVATEVSTVAGADYFAAHGSTNTGYVQGLYVDILLRAADASSLAYWVGRLDTAASTRAQVATSLVRSSEGAARRVGGTSGATACASIELAARASIPSGSYCIVLDRVSDSGGQSYWTGQLAGSSPLPALWASLAASAEYYTNAQT